MNENNPYRDDQNIEYKQRILLNETSCFFCEIERKEILIKCMECDKLFCNGKSENTKCHIVHHLKKSSHKTISLHPHNTIIKCVNKECGDNNIFNLYYLKKSDKYETYCKSHIPKEEEKNAKKYIDENGQISTEIVPEPTEEEDVKKLNEVNLIEINKRENILEKLSYVANRFLNKVKDKYDDKDEYYNIHKPLILCELEYARKICENKKTYNVNLIDLFQTHKKRPLYSFVYNKSHSKPFKVGNVYNFSKGYNSKEESLGLLVKIEKKKYYIVPVDKKRDKFEEDEYTVKEEFCSVPYDRMIAALDYFRDDYSYQYISSNLTKYILGKIDEIEDEEDEVKGLLDPFTQFEIKGFGKLNDSQIKAIKNSEKNVLNLIQGPPGTGKTFTASFLIYNIFLHRKNKDQKILVCCPTNAAADNISISLLDLNKAVAENNEKLEDKLDVFNILRIVARTRESIDYDKRVENISLHKYVDLDSDDFKEECDSVISSADIVVTTCSTSMIDKLEKFNFEFLVIDEATQSQEVETLIPMVRNTKHVTLIGDPKQLSPTILHPKGKQTGMHITLFERIMKLKPENNTLLTIQYRMHPKICEFISKTFYENKLKNGVNEKDREKEEFDNKFKWPNKYFPTVFINVEGENQISESGTSFVNEMECMTLVYLLKNKFPEEEIKNCSIITPYLGQKDLLEEFISDNNNINMEISSVDSFQGQERDYIIINTVRNNKKNEIGFLKDVKRLNVSISRAKYGLIIIGGAECLYNAKIEGKYSIWRKYIDYIKSNDALVTYNIDKNIFEKYELKKNENENNNNNINNIDDNIKDKGRNLNEINENNEEENYEEKYDYDGSKNNYNANLDLIYKDSRDRISDKFYYNPINQGYRNEEEYDDEYNDGYDNNQNGNYRRNNYQKNNRYRNNNSKNYRNNNYYNYNDRRPFNQRNERRNNNGYRNRANNNYY